MEQTNSFKIIIKTLYGNIYKIDVVHYTKILDIKQIIQNLSGLVPDSFRLIYNLKELKSNENLSDCIENLHNDLTICLIQNLRGD